MSLDTFYIDVSEHDRDRRGRPLDWTAIAGATGQNRVMVARASYGDPVVFNPTVNRWLEFMAGARDAGYDVRGGYHNVIRGDAKSMVRQVDLLRRQLDAGGAVWALGDVEKYTELVQRDLWPRWDDVRRFHDRWWSVEERQMMWYIAHWVWDGPLGRPDLRYLRGPLANAAYPVAGTGSVQNLYARSGGDKGVGWNGYGGVNVMTWQHTSTATVPGASDRTDGDAYRGTLGGLVTLLTGVPHEEADVSMVRYTFAADWGDEVPEMLRPSSSGHTRIVTTDHAGVWDVEPFSSPQRGLPPVVTLSRHDSDVPASWSFADVFSSITGGGVWNDSGSGLATFRKTGTASPGATTLKVELTGTATPVPATG